MDQCSGHEDVDNSERVGNYTGSMSVYSHHEAAEEYSLKNEVVGITRWRGKHYNYRDKPVLEEAR